LCDILGKPTIFECFSLFAVSNRMKGGLTLTSITSKAVMGEIDLSRLLSLYGDDLLRVCFLYLRDYHLAEDALQDTFEKAIRSYARFRGESEEKTWLTRIAINVCKNQLRTPWHRRRVDDAAFLAQLSIEQNPVDRSKEPLALAISRLAPKYKEVVLLFYYEDMKLKDIAVTLHIPEATVSTRLARARAQLKETAKEWYDGE
jgi:RNA polymerase sigma-70 factor (ECF subfamily)